jgi:valacyclovir hydrolase
MPVVEIATGAALDYIDTAEGSSDKPVLIVVHGLLGTAELHFGKIIEWLSPRFRILGPSLRGYGKSTPKPRTFSPDFYHRDARDVIAFMDALSIEKAHLMGYSDGGETVMLAAALAPERVHSVTAWGAVGFFGPELRAVAQRMYPGDWITQEEVELHGIPDRNAFVLSWINAFKSMIDAGGDVSLGIADRISAPLLLMLGEKDTLNPREYGEKMVARAQNGRLEMFPCGHPIQDQAWEAFQRVVGEFLDSVTAQP